MLIGLFSGPRAGRGDDRPRRRLTAAASLALSFCAALLVAGCAGMRGQEPARSTADAAAPIPPKDALPLDEATIALAEATLLRAQLPPPGPSGRHLLVIDPLIDRATGAETAVPGFRPRFVAVTTTVRCLPWSAVRTWYRLPSAPGIFSPSACHW